MINYSEYKPLEGGWWKMSALVIAASMILFVAYIIVTKFLNGEVWWVQTITMLVLFGGPVTMLIAGTPLKKWLPKYWNQNVIGYQLVFTLNEKFEAVAQMSYRSEASWFLSQNEPYETVAICINLSWWKKVRIWYVLPGEKSFGMDRYQCKKVINRHKSYDGAISPKTKLEIDSIEFSIAKTLVLFQKYFAQPYGMRVTDMSGLFHCREIERDKLIGMAVVGLREMKSRRGSAPNTKERTRRLELTQMLQEILDPGSVYEAELVQRQKRAQQAKAA